jgi:cytidylate kinase
MSDIDKLKSNRRGRPRADEPRTSVSTWLTTDQADRLIRIARRQDVSVSEVVRRIVTTKLRGAND